MKINFRTVLKDLDDEPIKDGDKDMTLGSVSKFALLAGFQDEKVEAAEKVMRFELASKINASMKAVIENGAQPDTEYKPEEIAKLREIVGRVFPPLIVGRFFELTG
jgi:hypothetical protein